jgi:general secretion pathway protein G
MLHTKLPSQNESGFTLLELVITLTILTILTLGAIPLVQVSVKRQKEQRLREALREIRTAIDEFHRDAIGSPCGSPQGMGTNNPAAVPTLPGNEGQPGPPGNPGTNQLPFDPRSKVVITDCDIFKPENAIHYPPTLEVLVEGVNVMPRLQPVNVGSRLGGAGFEADKSVTDGSNSVTSTKTRKYLRAIPIDPITGEAEWELRSTFDAHDATSWGGENVFDVRSKSEDTALNGEKYNEW